LLEGVFPAALVREFREHLKYSGAGSVDRFLESRPEFLEVGKAAIACAMIPLENPIRIFGEHSDARPQPWMEYLWRHLYARWEAFPENRLSVVTFNYDRSLEFYLSTCIQHTHKLSPEEAVKAVRDLGVVHVYGDLGSLERGDPGFRAYDTGLIAATLDKARKRLKVIPEERAADDLEFSRAKAMLKQAQRIYFLGFGFDRENLLRIKPSERVSAELAGSAFGLSEKERIAAEELLGDWEGTHQKRRLVEADCLGFLREKALLD